MIIIVKKQDIYADTFIEAVYDVNSNNPSQDYCLYLNELSKKYNIIINFHHYNIMSRELNSHLTDDVYKSLSKKWNKILHKNNFQWFLVNILKAIKVNYHISYTF